MGIMVKKVATPRNVYIVLIPNVLIIGPEIEVRATYTKPMRRLRRDIAVALYLDENAAFVTGDRIIQRAVVAIIAP